MAVQCALAGCTVEIDQPEKGPQRKFCCPAHRTAARAARLKSAAATPAVVATPVDADPSDETITAPAAAPEPAVETSAVAATSATPEPAAEADQQPGHGETLADADVARLPGTTPPVRTVRAGAGGASPDERPATTPRAPGDVPPALRREPVKLRRVRREPRRARAVIAGTLVVAMAFGGGVSLFDQSQDPASTVGAQRPTAPAANGQWLTEANVALASLSRQLDQARAAEARWNAALPEQRLPTEVQALVNRRQWLERQILLIQTQLAAYNNLDQTRAALATAQRNLDDLNAATAQPTTTVGSNAEAMIAQRDAAQREVDFLQARVQMLEQDVTRVTAAPVPDTTDITGALAQQVDDIVADPTRQRGPEGNNPAVLAQNDPATVSREPSSGDRPVALPDSGEPPRPPRGGGVVETLAAPVLGGGGLGDFPEPVTRPVREAPREVVRAVDDTVGGVGRTAGGVVDDLVSPLDDVVRPGEGRDGEVSGSGTPDLSTVASRPFRTLTAPLGEGGLLGTGGLPGGEDSGSAFGPRTGSSGPGAEDEGPGELLQSIGLPGGDGADAGGSSSDSAISSLLDPQTRGTADDGDTTASGVTDEATTGEPTRETETETGTEGGDRPTGLPEVDVVPASFETGIETDGATPEGLTTEADTSGAPDGTALASDIQEQVDASVDETVEEVTGGDGEGSGTDLGAEIDERVREHVQDTVEHATGATEDDAAQDGEESSEGGDAVETETTSTSEEHTTSDADDTDSDNSDSDNSDSDNSDSDNSDSDDTGSDDTGSDDTGSDSSGSDDSGSGSGSGSDDTGSDDTGSDDTGSDDTGSDDTGSDDSGSDSSGSDDTGSDDSGSDSSGSDDGGSSSGGDSDEG